MEKARAIQNAVDYARTRNSLGLLVNTNEENSEALMEDLTTDEGDRETVYSIISLYSDDEDNDGTWEAEMESRMKEVFPEHF